MPWFMFRTFRIKLRSCPVKYQSLTYQHQKEIRHLGQLPGIWELIKLKRAKTSNAAENSYLWIVAEGFWDKRIWRDKFWERAYYLKKRYSYFICFLDIVSPIISNIYWAFKILPNATICTSSYHKILSKKINNRTKICTSQIKFLHEFAYIRSPLECRVDF